MQIIHGLPVIFIRLLRGLRLQFEKYWLITLQNTYSTCELGLRLLSPLATGVSVNCLMEIR